MSSFFVCLLAAVGLYGGSRDVVTDWNGVAVDRLLATAARPDGTRSIRCARACSTRSHDAQPVTPYAFKGRCLRARGRAAGVAAARTVRLKLYPIERSDREGRRRVDNLHSRRRGKSAGIARGEQ